MISTLKVQTLETDLIEKIKAAINKRAEAKAKRMFLKRPKRLAKQTQEAGKTLADYTAITWQHLNDHKQISSRRARSFSGSVSRKWVAAISALTASRNTAVGRVA